MGEPCQLIWSRYSARNENKKWKTDVILKWNKNFKNVISNREQKQKIDSFMGSVWSKYI